MKLGTRTYCPERNYGMLHKKYEYSSYTGCRLSSTPTLISQRLYMYKATLKHPVSGTQTRVWWAGLVSPQPNNNPSLVYVWVRWLQYEDWSTRLFRKTLSKLWLLLDWQLSIDLRPSLMTSIWRLLYFLQNFFRCHWFANHQSSYIMIISAPNPVLIPINDSSDSCTYCLQHYRLWYPGLIPFMVTRLPLYVQTVGELFIGQRQLWCCSPFFRPPVSLGVAHQASHILHIHNDHIHKRGSTELYFLTIFFIGLRPSSMTPIEDCSTQPERLYAPFLSSAILLESSGMTPRTTILHRARHSDILSRSGHPLNCSMEN